MSTLNCDLLIVGGGAAGLRAATAAVEVEPTLDIAVVSKVYPMRSHTVSAEGGAAAVMREDDNLDLHAFDTIRGSDYLADQDATAISSLRLTSYPASKDFAPLEGVPESNRV